MVERRMSVALFSEPYRTDGAGVWAVSDDGTCAVFQRGSAAPRSWQILSRGEGFVSVQVGPVVFVSCYFSPNRSLRAFERFLSFLDACIRPHVGSALVVAGNFNARCSEWGDSLTTARGVCLGNWAAALSLQLLNVGHAPTVVRPQGRSLVDVTWGSSAVLPAVSA
ncbi:hypothetical protein DMN91_012149 [Ooceraea biroi]|uniref:Endonuclease/exonuclease/phosphatase domain-containing protein n=1 Tax=Ooceraea biroi TaxID=2015173 RepID=A0A3L8D3V4_OOCBI|nr:uncharacterized protein LOC105281485 [Ooceraea biroi]RLU15155.1 hypothetical protein DMN91_012149 [Ooceraea biroi]